MHRIQRDHLPRQLLLVTCHAALLGDALKEPLWRGSHQALSWVSLCDLHQAALEFLEAGETGVATQALFDPRPYVLLRVEVGRLRRPIPQCATHCAASKGSWTGHNKRLPDASVMPNTLSCWAFLYSRRLKNRPVLGL